MQLQTGLSRSAGISGCYMGWDVLTAHPWVCNTSLAKRRGNIPHPCLVFAGCVQLPLGGSLQTPRVTQTSTLVQVLGLQLSPCAPVPTETL